MARIVVVGAGVGGLAVAARLRVKGHQVTVVEASESPGGALASVRRDGFAFDLGPSVLTLPAVYRDLFLKTGGALEDSVELVPLDPGTQHRFADGTVTLPGVGVGAAAAAMGLALGDSAADDWRALMARAAQIWATIRRPVLETPLTAATDVTGLLDDRATRRTLAPRSSLRDLGREHLHDRRARQVLDHYALAAGADPREAPGTLVTLPYIEATFGEWHLAGGLGTLADALRRRLDERGATLLLGTRATRILVDGGRVVGVQCVPAGSAASPPTGGDSGTRLGTAKIGTTPDPGIAVDPGTTLDPGTVLDADIVVTDLDPGQVQHLLGTRAPEPRRPRGRISAAAFQLLLAVQSRTPGIGHTTVWHPSDPDAELDAVFGRRPHPAARPTIRACVPDDPAMRPDGHEAWTVAVTAPRHSPGGRTPGSIDWDSPGVAQRYADALLDELVRRDGPDLRGRILWRQLRTPADHERDTGAPGGATHGSTTDDRVLLRGAPNAAELPGLFHVGASAHPGPGLPSVGLSAELVATLIGRA